MTDPIADMLTRIRNASAVGRPEVVLPMSKIKFAVAKILAGEGWLDKVEIIKIKSKKNSKAIFDELKITLKYKRDKEPAITSLKRVSKPGRKIYVGKNDLPRVLNNLGIAIISTPRGVMTNREARKKGLGGEIICEVY